MVEKKFIKGLIKIDYIIYEKLLDHLYNKWTSARYIEIQHR